MPMKKENKKKRKQKNKLWNVIWILLAIAAIALLAFGMWKLSGEGKQPADTVVFYVGEELVYLDEVNLYCLENVVQLGLTTNQLDSVTAEDGRSASEYYKDEILTLIMNTKVTYKKAMDEGITLTKKEEEEVNNDAVSYVDSVSGSVLKEFGITMDTVTKNYRERYIVKKYSDTIVENVDVEDQKYCTLYMLMFPKVEVDEDGNYKKDEDGESAILLSEDEISQKKQDAEDALAMLKDGKEPEEVAKEYGIENVSGQESNLTGSFGDPIDEYASSLKKGECSPVLELDSAYVIVQMINENNKELADEILSYYKNDKGQEVLAESVQSWYEEYGIGEEPEWNGSLWDEISLYDFARYVEE